jgi:hypothetical protein
LFFYIISVNYISVLNSFFSLIFFQPYREKTDRWYDTCWLARWIIQLFYYMLRKWRIEIELKVHRKNGKSYSFKFHGPYSLSVHFGYGFLLTLSGCCYFEIGARFFFLNPNFVNWWMCVNKRELSSGYLTSYRLTFKRLDCWTTTFHILCWSVYLMDLFHTHTHSDVVRNCEMGHDDNKKLKKPFLKFSARKIFFCFFFFWKLNFEVKIVTAREINVQEREKDTV